MYRLPLDQVVLLVIQTALLVGLFARLWWAKLHRVYRYFFGYVLALLLQTVILSLVPFDRVRYTYAWMATEGLLVCFYALTVLELYTLVLRDLAGIASLSRRYIKVSMGLAILISLLLLLFERTPTGVTQAFLVFERAIAGSLLVFVLLITGFILYYPIPLNRNMAVYSIGYMLYFATKTVALFLSNLSHHWYREVSTVLVGVSTLCLLLWFVALNRRGETKGEVLGHRWQPQDTERLLSQLKDINSRLARAARK